MMLVPASIVLLLSFQFAAVLSAESCACEAEHLGFAIDCTDTATMLTAFNALQTSSCATDCSSEDCTLNYYIIQAHHDYCQDGEVPTEIEDGFHDFDTVCVACEIQRSATEGAPDCPTSVCDDGSGDAAYSAMLDAGCLTDCSPEACGTNFLTLVAVHDNCPHESLTTAAEEGLHDMESICTMHACNSATTAESQVVCDDHAHEGETTTTSSVKELTVNLATGFLVLIPFIALL
ncbi:hypothetical protein FisN_6Lh440 [Fistulifera solaris]|uniref:Uncharacterized protein n=1 Tax=Fistulifera solaris TaxID=1519565 RepID=A0A1Z5JKV9_FISSO|nr:hypothetical protein FisN_6Lh440 [Fistulifera solaris]|eukprot:GAX14655.1 hypothetical protein FisN_6Lh440 [Fistulifera solaris]